MIVNFRREIGKMDVPERLLNLLDDQFRDLRRVALGLVSPTITVSIGGTSSSGGGGGTIEYRVSTATIASGANTVVFSSALSSSNYRAQLNFLSNDGTMYNIDERQITKSATGFTYTSSEAGTLVYFCFIVQ